VVFLYAVFIVIEVNCIKTKELVEGSIYRYVSVLEFLCENFDLAKESKITLQNGKYLLGDKEDSGCYLSFGMYIMLHNFILKIL
jgi:hypothetical protein